MSMKKKKNAREKRVLIGAVAVAGVMIAGSTFAWFTSKDEVTNRLSAHADYNVSIVEDFTPPENLTPGQTVNKNVSAVNTGNVDAFVRMGIENMLNITVPGKQDITVTTTADSTTNPPYTDYTFTFTAPTLTNAIKLSTEKTQNADGTLSADEVTTLQAGGELVVAANKSVRVADQAIRSGAYKAADYEYDDTGKFTPTTAGLYLFRRTVTEGAANNATEYSGYYFDGTDYYALATKANGAYVDATITETAQGDGKFVSAIDGLKLKTKVEKAAKDTASNLTMTWAKADGSATTTPSEATKIKVVYDPTSAETTNPTTDDVTFWINLVNDWSTNWTYVAASGIAPTDGTGPIGAALGYFYYNDDLEAGATSARLIDSIKMDDHVTQDAFIDLTYDINVILDSVQVTKDQNQKETADSLTGWATATLTNETTASKIPGGSSVADGLEITAIAWA